MNRFRFKSLVVLTGAGISAESGVRTFRDSNGLWENHRIEEVATPEAFINDPVQVHRFYNARRKQLFEVSPNPAHIALAKLEQEWEGSFLLVTQNVDDLHERAGSKSLLHMHGELKQIFCLRCEVKMRWTEDLSVDHVCPSCGESHALRPDIVWFGEVPYHMEQIGEALSAADLFISIGTSGKVYPAAAFSRMAWKAHKIEVNLTLSDVSDDFHEHRVGPAGVEVPKLVSELLEE